MTCLSKKTRGLFPKAIHDVTSNPNEIHAHLSWFYSHLSCIAAHKNTNYSPKILRILPDSQNDFLSNALCAMTLAIAAPG